MQSSSSLSLVDKRGTEDSKMMMDLFVGNLSLYTTEAKLRDYFSSFGSVSSVKICTHPENGKNKRFGFLNFENNESIDNILKHPAPHEIDNKVLEVRYASRNFMNKRSKVGSANEEDPNCKGKVFVGGVSQSTNVEEMKAYFIRFGPIASISLLPDHITGRHRGFGFVTFESDSTAEVVCAARFHTIKMKKVECKKASLSRSSKAVDRKPPTFSLLNPGNKNPGLLGEHPWQILSPPHTSTTLLLDPMTLYSHSSSFALPPPIYPLQPANTSLHNFKALNHRYLSEVASVRHSPYTLTPGRVHQQTAFFPETRELEAIAFNKDSPGMLQDNPWIRATPPANNGGGLFFPPRKI
uniref:RNA-binding protein Musashi homolog 2 n=1 Tax=Caligus clemensi TaxID=344056 RepID=C1C393_CALCM|nr:RNA-binding protein Musashi homolog 2 [Caligus clemensi]